MNLLRAKTVASREVDLDRAAAIDRANCGFKQNSEASPVGFAARSHPRRYEPHAEPGNVLSGISKYRCPFSST